MSLIEIKNISAGYGKEHVIEEVSINMEAGELVGMLGVNGSGKSTFVKAICGILPHAGNVSVDGEEIEKLGQKAIAKKISYVPQRSGVSLDISVIDVVMMGFNPRLKIFENPGRDMYEKALEVISGVGLSGLEKHNFLQLSEGQKQLVIFARAMVGQGGFLVMDEPESALDFGIRQHMMSNVRKWVNEEKRAGLIVLHDTMLALNNCDRIILIKDKKIVGNIVPKTDTIDKMEEKLRLVYGDVGLVKTMSKSGADRLVMINENGYGE